VKIQIMGGKVSLWCKGNIAGHCQQALENKKSVDITLQCFALLPQVNFAANNLNFTEGEGDGIEYRLSS
jgi:hypothetical protein